MFAFVQDCWTIFLAALLLIVFGIPSLTIINWAIKERIEHAKSVFSWGSRVNHDLLMSVAGSDLAKGGGAESQHGVDGANLPFNLYADGSKPLLANAESSSSSATGAEGEVVARSVQFDESVGQSQSHGSHRVSGIRKPHKLTMWQHVQSSYLSLLFYSGLLIVVDPSDVMGLDAIGVGVANTLSQSLRISHVSTNSTHVAANEGPSSVGNDDNSYGDGAAVDEPIPRQAIV